jgi:hypothetical protein
VQNFRNPLTNSIAQPYVSVGLQYGRALLLRRRLAEAIRHLPQYAGTPVLRRHWVDGAALSVLQRMREGRWIIIVSGQMIPVASHR